MEKQLAFVCKASHFEYMNEMSRMIGMPKGKIITKFLPQIEVIKCRERQKYREVHFSFELKTLPESIMISFEGIFIFEAIIDGSKVKGLDMIRKFKKERQTAIMIENTKSRFLAKAKAIAIKNKINYPWPPSIK